jgi:hypothetical protein
MKYCIFINKYVVRTSTPAPRFFFRFSERTTQDTTATNTHAAKGEGALISIPYNYAETQSILPPLIRNNDTTRRRRLCNGNVGHDGNQLDELVARYVVLSSVCVIFMLR